MIRESAGLQGPGVPPVGRIDFRCSPALATPPKNSARKMQFAEQIQSDLGRPAAFAKIFPFSIYPNQF
jgi:hypothetical protein